MLAGRLTSCRVCAQSLNRSPWINFSKQHYTLSRIINEFDRPRRRLGPSEK